MDDRPTCLACKGRLPAPVRASGRKRVYCSDGCRKAWHKHARRAPRPASPPPDADDLAQIEWLIDNAFVEIAPVPAAAEVIAVLQSLAIRARRLAVEAPPGLAWRHESTAAALGRLLADFWALD